MFQIFKTLFGQLDPKKLAENGRRFYEQLQNLDDAKLPLETIQGAVSDEMMGRLLHHAQRFPWQDDNQMVTAWKTNAENVLYTANGFWLEFKALSDEGTYLEFDILRNPGTPLKNFTTNSGSRSLRRRESSKQIRSHYLLHTPPGNGSLGSAIYYRVKCDVGDDSIMHIGDCRVYLEKNRLAALTEWDREMAETQHVPER
jgi:hypothetical protein